MVALTSDDPAPPSPQSSSLSPRFAVRAALPRVVVVVAYAVAMAYVEAAAVLYLRTLYGGIDPVGPRNPAAEPPVMFWLVELGREAATVVMLAAVGWLAGRGQGGRLGAFCLAFGVWDVFYYVFLYAFTGWPAGLLAPDVLFLIPLPWWGPVLTPALVAALIATGGALAMARELGDGLPSPGRAAWLLMLVGALLCLAAFMADAIGALPRGLAVALAVRGGAFPWTLYAVGFFLGATGIARALTRPIG